MALALRVAGVSALALVVANCSAQKTVGKIDPKYGVAPSPRVVEPGQPVPKGGGRELVGKPYTVAGRVYTPRENPNYTAVGTASWYGSAFHGRLTANGEVFDRGSVAAAHPTLPLPSYVRVTNLSNNRSMVVRVNDRGPYHGNRLIDVSQRAAEALDFHRMGTARVKVEYLGRASLRGSDDRKLLATLRIDGTPANLPGGTAAPIMVASAEDTSPAPEISATPAVALSAAGAPAATAASLVPLAPRQAAPLVTAAAMNAGGEAIVGRPVTGIPLPPERPFDLGTIPNAGVPVAVAVPTSGAGRSAAISGTRPVVASLFYAPAEAPAVQFGRNDPMAGLKPQRFVAFKTHTIEN
ncbi:septal ring lytic transglycosylase RlpA family protein [Chelatococcus sp. SYSU_G07232]|uniref:Endolytic peptidoglycan transglycosylase RlpA n=1 Tax=Chelatococcus albus TaxID=3047466 RepID=A0ABT7ACK2_9HYPH|nr:septal ring lytic transglycosylase RlpA family protein [Chelatococcus sp. SYSU_G07232]MDJ1156790.1 septal ring lytic transglycosylase RlpA family protein [Chelatococcus sp. SYSU_G07232]